MSRLTLRPNRALVMALLAFSVVAASTTARAGAMRFGLLASLPHSHAQGKILLIMCSCVH